MWQCESCSLYWCFMSFRLPDHKFTALVQFNHIALLLTQYCFWPWQNKKKKKQLKPHCFPPAQHQTADGHIRLMLSISRWFHADIWPTCSRLVSSHCLQVDELCPTVDLSNAKLDKACFGEQQDLGWNWIILSVTSNAGARMCQVSKYFIYLLVCGLGLWPIDLSPNTIIRSRLLLWCLVQTNSACNLLQIHQVINWSK